MTLDSKDVNSLENAISRYAFPPVTYDFLTEREVRHANMREVESKIRDFLTSGRRDEVKYGLAKILYWGWARRPGIRDHRVRRFLRNVAEEQLNEAARGLALLDGPGLRRIESLGLPEFSRMSFVSKVRMFLDPEQFVVLDRTLAGISTAKQSTLFGELKVGTSIGITARNEAVYRRWCDLCVDAAGTYFGGTGVIAADIERGIFQMVNDGQTEAAARIVANI